LATNDLNKITAMFSSMGFVNSLSKVLWYLKNTSEPKNSP